MNKLKVILLIDSQAQTTVRAAAMHTNSSRWQQVRAQAAAAKCRDVMNNSEVLRTDSSSGSAGWIFIACL